jgi:xylan 1,4-beta-xylosidase
MTSDMLNSMKPVGNPILPGFNPDPSIVRVGKDYYLATSTFEWFPGIPIYHSRDLANWRMIGHAIKHVGTADLAGIPDSGGIWAPSLSYADGRFYLLYTIVHNRTGAFRDLNNYLITAASIDGPWSDPIHLNSSGFDPALMHDDDGRKWLVNMQWDYRPGHARFAGIILQEYSLDEHRLVGPVHLICDRQPLVEGPNLYKYGGYYYLMLAEGGTDWNHSISMMRSKSITGPYEPDPQPFVLTSRLNPAIALQKAGHGELVQASSGEWYLAHLCSRPLYPERRCPLGRETAIQRVKWTQNGWLRLMDGGDAPSNTFIPPTQPTDPQPRACNVHDDFDLPTIACDWQSLRVPIESSWANTTERPGYLRLRGRQSLQSHFYQSLLARRITHFHVIIETVMEFTPVSPMQVAGLVLYYDTRHHYYLRVVRDERRGLLIGVVATVGGVYTEYSSDDLVMNDGTRTYLQARIEGATVRFAASADGKQWHGFPGTYDFTQLSSDFAGGFTGAMAGICAQDLQGTYPGYFTDVAAALFARRPCTL